MASEQHSRQQESRQPEPQSLPPRERRFRVLETAEVPRGASFYTLPKGKTISSMGYDITALKNQGVRLEEVTS